MPRVSRTPVDLTGLVLTDARTATDVDLGARPGTWLLTAIRHRF